VAALLLPLATPAQMVEVPASVAVAATAV